MATIGRTAGKMIGLSTEKVVNMMNCQAVKKGSAAWLKKNGALTEVGKDVYHSEKTIYKAKNLKEYLQNLVQAAKTQKFAEPFDTILKNLGKSSS